MYTNCDCIPVCVKRGFLRGFLIEDDIKEVGGCPFHLTPPKHTIGAVPLSWEMYTAYTLLNQTSLSHTPSFTTCSWYMAVTFVAVLCTNQLLCISMLRC